MERALWLWSDGYITKESHDHAKLTKSSSIVKVRGIHGRLTKKTNFSKDECGVNSDIHMRDVMTIEPEKLRVLEGDIRASAAKILSERRGTTKRRAGPAGSSDKNARRSGYERRIASSDSDFWFVPPFLSYVDTILTLSLDRISLGHLLNNLIFHHFPRSFGPPAFKLFLLYS